VKRLLEQIHNYLRRKLKELNPEFISVTVMVPKDIHRDLEDEFPSEPVGDRPVVSFSGGSWPEQTILNFTPIPDDE